MNLKFSKSNTTILHQQLATTLSDETSEYEIVFNNKNITYDKFHFLIKRLHKLKKKYKLEKKFTEELDISFSDKSKDIRITLLEKGDIINYCKKNTINYTSPHLVLYKKRFEHIGNKGFFNSKEYSLRSNLKTEIDCDTVYYGIDEDSDSNEPIIRYNLPQQVEDNEKLKDEIKKQVHNFYDEKIFESMNKFYRYKKRYSFKSEDNLFKIDLTVVKESKKISKTFKKSQVLDNDNKYEIEIEYIGNKNHNSKTLFHDNKVITDNKVLKKCKKSLYKHIGVVLQVLQNTFYIISNTEKNLVNDIFNKLIRNIVMKKLNNKITILKSMTKQKKIEDIDNILNQYNNYSISDCYELLKCKTNNIETITKHFNKELNQCARLLEQQEKNKYFKYSPKPITLEINNLDKEDDVNIINIDKKPNNIGTLYTVTDKAEGAGNMLYVLGLSQLSDKDKQQLKEKYYRDNTKEYFTERLNDIKGNVYMIDSNNNIIFSGCSVKENLNTILNGEYMIKNKNNKTISRYLAYDIYYTKNTDLNELPLMRTYKCKNYKENTNSRYNILNKVVRNLQSNIKIKLFSVVAKDFYMATNDISIYEQSKIIH